MRLVVFTVYIKQETDYLCKLWSPALADFKGFWDSMAYLPSAFVWILVDGHLSSTTLKHSCCTVGVHVLMQEATV